MACAPTCTLAPLFSEQCFRFPLIINAPMAHFAGGDLAAAVTLAGGLGMIGCINDAAWLSSQLDQCAILLRNASPEFEKLPTVPIGIGFLPFAAQLTKFVPLVKKYRPKVVWLFAAESVEVYTRWATEMRRACPGSQIWIQTGSMHEALEIAAQAKPDVLVLQGSDAGGHGHERSASLISLLPEAVDIFKRGKIEIPIVASGGISDARGAAAAFTLGAQGVVMGTRFLGSKEVLLHPTYQAAVIEARFGGSNTVRSKFFDDLTVPNPWPKGYDGRSLAVKSYQEWLIDRNMERARRLYAEAKTHESGGFARGCKGVAPIWAGASLGLVNKLSFAGEIIHETRRGARAVLETLGAEIQISNRKVYEERRQILRQAMAERQAQEEEKAQREAAEEERREAQQEARQDTPAYADPFADVPSHPGPDNQDPPVQPEPGNTPSSSTNWRNSGHFSPVLVLSAAMNQDIPALTQAIERNEAYTEQLRRRRDYLRDNFSPVVRETEPVGLGVNAWPNGSREVVSRLKEQAERDGFEMSEAGGLEGSRAPSLALEDETLVESGGEGSGSGSGVVNEHGINTAGWELQWRQGEEYAEDEIIRAAK